jgi:hypothetical protein
MPEAIGERIERAHLSDFRKIGKPMPTLHALGILEEHKLAAMVAKSTSRLKPPSRGHVFVCLEAPTPDRPEAHLDASF